MTLLNFDITKRSDAARKSWRRAELKLEKESKKAGGLENEMRYQLTSLNREQTTLRKELHTLKFESRLSSRRASEGLTSRSSEDFFSTYGENNLLSRRRASDYGKNFFGYQSVPGSKKVVKKTTRQLEKSLDNYCKKIDELMHEEDIGRKLDCQEKENRSVQDKLKLWMGKNSPGKRVFETKTENEHAKQMNGFHNEKMPELSGSGSSSHSRSSPAPAPSDPNPLLLPPIQPPPEPAASLPDWFQNDKRSNSAKLNTKTENSTNKSQLKRESSTLVFDADLYAPDGRMRMAHRLPEFHLAFQQARQTRYIRTKEKRDFEIQLSVDEIFEKSAKSHS